MDKKKIIYDIKDIVYPLSNIEKYYASSSDSLKIIWDAPSFAVGIPGVILFLNEFNSKYDENLDIKPYINKLSETISKQENISFSLMDGLAGVAFSLSIINYWDLVDEINTFFLKMFPKFLDQIDTNDLSFQTYDVMTGISGILHYLIQIDCKINSDSLKKIILLGINKLIDIYNNKSTSKVIRGKLVPFYVSSKYFYSDIERKQFGNGGVNLGLSHGILGPFMVLVEAIENNLIDDEKYIEVIDDLYLIMWDSKEIRNKRVDWPSIISNEADSRAAQTPIFDSWCYGTPSILYHLYKYAIIKKNYHDMQYIEKQMVYISNNIEGIKSSSFCHGVSGLINIFINFNFLASKNVISLKTINDLEQRVIKDYHSPTYPFFEEHYSPTTLKSEKTLDLGVLTGLSGIALTLMREFNQKQEWTNIFCI